MRIQFIRKLKLNNENKNMLFRINSIINEYKQRGYQMTLRQLYYQLVSRDVIPNNDNQYAKLGNLLTKGRMAGIVDWDAIEDRVRVPRITYWVDDVANAVNDAHDQYRLDRQEGQKNYIELWVEKDALSNILQRKTDYYHVRLMVNRGYSSTTAMFDAYQRFMRQIAKGKEVHVLYTGDFDPSGRDMLRDIRERLIRMLGNAPMDMGEVVDKMSQEELNDLEDYVANGNTRDEFRKEFIDEDGNFNYYMAYAERMLYITSIALTWEQIQEHKPPTNPAKISDPRAKWYIAEYGEYSWEVDALDPVTLHTTIDEHIKDLIDMKLFDKMMERELMEKKELKTLLPKAGKVDSIKELIDGFKKPKRMSKDLKKLFTSIEEVVTAEVSLDDENLKEQ